ncbi:MAG TPA: hypothetical protein VIP56_03260 [Nitrososphaeraceae archaeon]
MIRSSANIQGIICLSYGLQEGRDVIKNELGLEITEEQSPQSADIFNKLKLRKDQVPKKPLTERKLE